MTYTTLEEINWEDIENSIQGSLQTNKDEIKEILKKLIQISKNLIKLSLLKDFLEKNFNDANDEYTEEIISFVNNVKDGKIKKITKENKPNCLDFENYFEFAGEIAEYNKIKQEKIVKTHEEDLQKQQEQNSINLSQKENEINNCKEELQTLNIKITELENINDQLKDENEHMRIHKLATSFETQRNKFENKLSKKGINLLIVLALIPSLLSITIFFLNIGKADFWGLNFGNITIERYNYIPFITMTGILIYGIVFYMKNYNNNQKIATLFSNKQAIADSLTTLLKFLSEDKIDKLDPKEKEELQKQFVSKASTVLYNDININDDNKLPIDSISEIVKEVIKKLPINN